MAPEFRAPLSGRTDEAVENSRLVHHRDHRGLAVPRVAFEGDLLRVDERVGLEVIHEPARAPRPGAERAPVLGLPVFALVDQADDALPQVVAAAVRLDAGGAETAVAPAERGGG